MWCPKVLQMFSENNFTLENRLLLTYCKKHSHKCELVGEMLKRKQTKYIHSIFHLLRENQIVLTKQEACQESKRILALTQFINIWPLEVITRNSIES